MNDVLVVGSVAFDTLHLPSGTHLRVPGGSATYASLAASLFAPVRLVGVVGRDWPADVTRTLVERGVDVEGLEIVDGLTFHWEGRYSDDLTHRTSLRTELNVFADFHPRIPERHRDTPYVLLGNIHPELQAEVLAQMRAPRLVLADTMSFWIRGARLALERLLRRVDVLVINEEEARELAGMHNIVRVGRALLAMGPRHVVVKRGEYGALLFDGPDEIFWAPAYPVADVVDPTGAGDSFAGGLLGHVAQGGGPSPERMRRAVIVGSAVASCCVEAVGLEGLLATNRADIEARFRRFQTLAHFAPPSEIEPTDSP
ncbi:MAG: PfkB family carbohydrate kinase [Myxococcota bacterium]|nr:PfkB family carbohydrate kinase [Myxococcota bacterium]